MWFAKTWAWMVAGCVALSGVAVAQDKKPTAPPSAATERGGDSSSLLRPKHGEKQDPASGLWRPITTERTMFRNVISDQIAIWRSPFEVRAHDLSWLAPFAGGTALLVSGDQEISRRFPGKSDSSMNTSRSLSQYGTFALVGAAGGAWAWGRLVRNDHARETGLLSAEAVMNSVLLNYGLKHVASRERPGEGSGNGRFFQSGGSSFPSDHSMIAWSAASVIGSEYPGRFPKLFAYGLASAVSLSRVASRDHFPSDVVVGSTLGFLIGKYVYRTHHDPELPGAAWGKDRNFQQEGRRAGWRGTTYVPLDSWVYPAFERLAALGAVPTAYLGQRPWSEAECQRLLEEAEHFIDDEQSSTDEVTRLYHALRAEFESTSDAPQISLDSVYLRTTGISGTPLNDGFHFEQTLYNDHGRPYQGGVNAIAGATARATGGPFFAYVQTEYQHAPGAAGYSQPVLQAIAAADSTLPDQAAPLPAVNRVRLLEAYVGASIAGWQISFGKQSLWWGPSAAGPFLMSDNAEPPIMLRVTRQTPRKLPSLLGRLGPFKSEYFFGQLAGHRFVQGHLGQVVDPQPYIHGEKMSFKPTPNLEIGVSKTAIFGGLGSPLTLRRLISSYSTFGNCTTAACDPGDRRVGFDFRYRLPGLRKYVQVYTDSFAEDEPFPVAYPRRSAWNPGVYITQIPFVPNLDLRVEHLFTPTTGDAGFFYNNIVYRSGYTQDGQLLGSWIGREGRSTLGWLTYWLSPQSTLQFNYRVAKSSAKFLQGGTLTDLGAKADLMVRPDTRLIARLQYETWNFPLLSSTARSNVVASVELVYHPKWLLRRRSAGAQPTSKP